MDWQNSLGNFTVPNNMQIGPGGGWIDNDYSGGMVFSGTISDLEPEQLPRPTK